MFSQEYNISYGPPLIAKDGPHRMLETVAPLDGEIVLPSFDVGPSLVADDVQEILPQEIAAQDVGSYQHLAREFRIG